MQSDQRLQSELEEAGLQATVVHDAPAVAPEETALVRSTAGLGYRAFAPYFEVWRDIAVPAYEQPLLLRFAETELHSEPLPVPVYFGSSVREPAASSQIARDALMRFVLESASQYAVAVNVPSEDRTSHLSAHLCSARSPRARPSAPPRTTRRSVPASEERVSQTVPARSHRDFFRSSLVSSGDGSETLQEKMRLFFARTHLRRRVAAEHGLSAGDVVSGSSTKPSEHPHACGCSVVPLFDCVDWRVGRDEWERWTVEDDPALATGNWQWIAGVGADMAQYPRIYNPERQRRRDDPNGTYVRRWVRELESVPMAVWHGGRVDDAQLALALFPADAYPAPAVEHERAARDFLARYRLRG